MDTPKNLCNDLNRVVVIYVIGLAISNLFGKPQSLPVWKEGLLRDIGTLMIYHQVLSYIANDDPMMGDLIKTGVLLLVPNLRNPDWTSIGMILGGVVLYHKVIRPTLTKKLKESGIGFDEGIEDIVESLLLLGLSNDRTPKAVATQIAALSLHHMYTKY